jgi:membrane-bound lytic murein transglycosylase D
MKIPWTLIAIMVGTTLMANKEERPSLDNHFATSFENRWSSTTEEDLEDRIKNIELPFAPRLTSHVKSQIKRYVTNGYRDTERMLGRSVLYFPVFEHYLKQYNLPHELKYLPIIESRLNAKAKSAVGASGLWQFIPATGRAYGLTINDAIDERLNPYAATEAAAKMLAALYEDFGDWSLVLAAYNCGPARVKKAMRLSGGSDFWAVSQYLPKETRNYVPRYIAAAYIANYYTYHKIEPKFSKLMPLDVRTFRVYNYMRFRDIAYVTGVSATTLNYLNPGYMTGVIPVTSEGFLVTLPAEAAPAFRKYLEEKAAAKDKDTMTFTAPQGTLKSLHTVKAGETLASLARLCKCNIKEIMLWNNLRDENIVVNQELVLYLPKEAVFYRP